MEVTLIVISQALQFVFAIVLLWIGLSWKGDRRAKKEFNESLIKTLEAMEKRADRTDARLQILEGACHENHKTFTLGKRED